MTRDALTITRIIARSRRSAVSKAPLLIVIDEFGKSRAANNAPTQTCTCCNFAEAAQSQRGSRIYLVTMQHLAFNEYASAVDSAQQREWAKSKAASKTSRSSIPRHKPADSSQRSSPPTKRCDQKSNAGQKHKAQR